MSLKIKEISGKLSLKQLDLIYELEREAFQETGLSRYEIAPFAELGKIFLFYDGSKIAGHAIVLRYYDEDSAFIFSFALRKNLRGKGLGSKFFPMLIAEIPFRRITLTVAPWNKAAIKIYERSGFKRVRYLKNFYGKSEPRILMEFVRGQGD